MWDRSTILAPGILRQEDCKLEASLGYKKKNDSFVEESLYFT